MKQKYERKLITGKKILSVVSAAAVLLTSGCSLPELPELTLPGATEPPVVTTTPAPAGTTTTVTTTAPEKTSPVTEAPEEQNDISGMVMRVSNDDGKMNITRAAKKNTSMGEPDTWTIFVYLCGTDLESDDYGAATDDLIEMTEAEESDNVTFIVQTGGTKEWMNNIVGSENIERYIIRDNDMELLGSVEPASMGDPAVLADFLKWGVAEYPAEKMGVIFWDHGGGSITGVCFDELYDDDSLSLADLNTAFSDVYDTMTDRFEFIGFDACLMSTVETANVLATYARYLYASQETEPGSGWDYETIGTFLADDPSADGAELGRAVTDSYYDACAEEDCENESTFSVTDLDKVDSFVTAFNDFVRELYNAALDNAVLSEIVRNVNSVKNFGGNNQIEGYTNMVDIGGIISTCSGIADGRAALRALDKCVIYKINGSDYKGSSGLSVYYPLQLQGSEELGIFSGVCISPYYLSLVDMIAKGYSDNGYTNTVFFTEDGDWTNENCDSYFYDSGYFAYADEQGSGYSELIWFADDPHIEEDGYYCFTLDEFSLEYTAMVSADIWLDLDDGDYIALGETFDIYADWETGKFEDNFDGYWLALPNGDLLATYIVDYTDEYAVYTSPITLNGEETNLRIRVYDDYTTYIEGAWDGIGENGIASRDIRSLDPGDKIACRYICNDEFYITMDEYTWQDGDEIEYTYLPEAYYYYSFTITDIFGDVYYTDEVEFLIDEDGTIYYV